MCQLLIRVSHQFTSTAAAPSFAGSVSAQFHASFASLQSDASWMCSCSSSSSGGGGGGAATTGRSITTVLTVRRRLQAA